MSDKYRFDAFGVELPGGKMSPNAYKVLNNPFGYNGEQYDPEAGLSYLRNRYYESATGRFMNRDLLPGYLMEPLSMNAYAFVGNDPLQYVDTLGLEKIRRYRIFEPICAGESNSYFNFGAFLSPSNLLGEISGAYSAGKYTNTYIKDGFNVELNGKYAIINGARSESALAEGIYGTRYALENANSYPQVFKFVEPATAIRNALNPKTLGGKLGYAGIALDTGSDIYNDINNGAGGKKIAADVTVDVGFGIGGIAASTATGAAIGSVVPVAGIAIGAATGLVVGVGYTIVTEVWTPGGKSIKDRAKVFLNNLF